jgi:hypothetical protein
MLLGQEESGEDDNTSGLQPDPNEDDHTIEEAVVSMHVTQPNPYIKCMRFKGQLGHAPSMHSLTVKVPIALWTPLFCMVNCFKLKSPSP